MITASEFLKWLEVFGVKIGGGGGGGGSPTTTLWADPIFGMDVTGAGTAVTPFKTLEYALTSITDNSATQPYTLLINGIFSETSLAIKPFVDFASLSNTAAQIGISGGGSITLDSSWPGNNSQTCTLNNITFATGTDFALDFSGFSFTTGNTVNINNCIINGNLGFIGRTGFFDNLVLVNTYCLGAVSITNCSSQSGSYLTTYLGTFDIIAASSTANIFWTSSADSYYAPITISGTSTQEVILNVTNSAVQTTVTVSATNGAFQYDVASWPSGGLTGVSFPLGKAAVNVVQPPTVVTSSSYNTLPSDYIVNVNYAGAVSIIITSEVVESQVIMIKDISGMAAINNITITAASGATIENASSYVLNRNLQSVTLIVDVDGKLWAY